MSDRFDEKRAGDRREPQPGNANPAPPHANPDLWRNVLALVSDAVYIHHPNGPFLAVNDAACRMLGYTAAELCTLGPQDVDLPEYAELVPGRVADLERAGRTIFESVHVARDGTRIPVEIHARRLELGGEPYIVTVARDITAHKHLVEQLRAANENLERTVRERTRDLNLRNEELSRENAQRRQMEERLRASEEKYRLIVETTREGVWIIDARNKTTFANPRMAEMLGCTVEEMAGAGLFDFMDDEGRRIAERNVERRRRGIHEQHDFKFIRKDGAPVWTLIETSPIHEPCGAYAGAMALVTDITERRRQEVEMEQLALEWQETFDKVADPIFLMTPDFLITRCNEALCALTGLGRDQIVGRRCCMVVHGMACPVDGCPALLAARSCCRCMSEIEFRGRCFEVFVDPIVGVDGRVISSIHIMRDITRRKESEASLRSSEARWRTLVAHAPILITLLDAGGEVRFCNQPLRLLGREQVLGMPVVQLLPPEAGRRLAAALGDVFAGRLPQRYEMESRDQAGAVTWFEHRVAPVLEDGRVAGAIWVAVNITDLKQAEARLRDLNRSLEDRVMARTQELESAQSELVMRAKMASIGQMAAGIAHEINNPVSFVATNIAALQQHLDALRQMHEEYRAVIARLPLDGGLSGMVEVLHEKERRLAIDYTIRDLDRLVWESAEGLRRVTRILTGVRNFSHQSRSEKPAAYDLNAAVRDTLILSRSAYLDTVEVHTELGPLPEVLCIPAQINQVILNLFMNAVQALQEPDREVKGRIDIRTWHVPGWVMCEIRDDGPGLPEEYRDRVFRESFSTKSYQQGTGLGLTICHDIVVNRHGGRISFTCPPGGGTAFLVELPDGTGAPDSGNKEDPP